MAAPKIDTVQAKDCYDPANYVTVHKDYLARLRLAVPQREKWVSSKPIPRVIIHAYELEM